jgi:aromatic-L-amino-acid decarboxylase
VTPDEFRRAGHALIDWIADYREALARGEPPVRPNVEPGDLVAALPREAPERGEPFEAILADLDRLVLPGVMHWQHPRFFGWFPSGGSLPSVLGDLASTGLAVVGLSWQAAPALTELEQVTTDWLRDLLGLPSSFQGVLQDTASTATFVALVCARERDFGSTGAGMQGRSSALVVYASAQAHSSVEKAAMLAGFGRAHFRAIEVDADRRMRPDRLAAAIA